MVWRLHESPLWLIPVFLSFILREETITRSTPTPEPLATRSRHRTTRGGSVRSSSSAEFSSSSPGGTPLRLCAFNHHVTGSVGTLVLVFTSNNLLINFKSSLCLISGPYTSTWHTGLGSVSGVSQESSCRVGVRSGILSISVYRHSCVLLQQSTSPLSDHVSSFNPSNARLVFRFENRTRVWSHTHTHLCNRHK